MTCLSSPSSVVADGTSRLRASSLVRPSSDASMVLRYSSTNASSWVRSSPSSTSNEPITPSGSPRRTVGHVRAAFRATIVTGHVVSVGVRRRPPATVRLVTEMPICARRGDVDDGVMSRRCVASAPRTAPDIARSNVPTESALSSAPAWRGTLGEQPLRAACPNGTTNSGACAPYARCSTAGGAVHPSPPTSSRRRSIRPSSAPSSSPPSSIRVDVERRRRTRTPPGANGQT